MQTDQAREILAYINALPAIEAYDVEMTERNLEKRTTKQYINKPGSDNDDKQRRTADRNGVNRSDGGSM